jgi:gluconolactonase
MTSRRDILASAGAAVAIAAVAPNAFAPGAFAAWTPSERYPDPAVQSLDPSFNKYRLALAGVERLAAGCRFNEGAVYFGDARCLLWSDIPNNRILRWDEETGRTSVFRAPSSHANGNTRDRQGRLVTCEHSGRRVTRTEYDGTITVLMDKFDGKPLNGTNDVVVKSDDSIWFTDPPSGIAGNYLGEAAKQELPNNVYRLDPKTARAAVATTGLVKRPNGLAFSPDETKLYVIESDPVGRAFYVFDVVDGGAKLANGRVFFTVGAEETPMASASTLTATSGAAGAWAARRSTASRSSIPRASRSDSSRCRSARPMSVSAGRSAIACSWRRATRSIRSM